MDMNTDVIKNNLKDVINSEIAILIAKLDEFKGQFNATHKLVPERLLHLKKVATIESIGSSTRIEGATLTNHEVEVLLRGIKIASFKSRDEQEVLGYAELMETIFSSWEHMPITENHIKQCHAILLKYSDKDERHRGEYKKLPNHVEAFDETGKSVGVVFETATPFDTPFRMQELIAATNELLIKGEIHPLTSIGWFVKEFLKIHPFQDGNGRLSRTLTTLLLLKHGYHFVPYSSFEKVIEDNKSEYYIKLRRAQTADSDKGLQEWTVFFLKCMQTLKERLEKKLGEEALLQSLPTLSVQIIEIIKSRGQVSVSQIVDMTHANRNTIKAHLKKLVRLQYLDMQGIGKGTKYRSRI